MTEGIRQRPDAPLAGAELALPYLLDDPDFVDGKLSTRFMERYAQAS